MTDKERAALEAARKVAKWGPVGCLEYRKDCEELDASLASLDADKPWQCTLGVGCDEAGVCYAAAHGQPDHCADAFHDADEPETPDPVVDQDRPGSISVAA